MTFRTGTLALLILLIGGALRITGVGYGLPFPLVSDEEGLIGGALRMAELRTLLPVFHTEAMAILYYPPLLSYLYLSVSLPALGLAFLLSGAPLSDLAAFTVLNLDIVWLSSRLTSVLFSTATLWIVYLIGARAFSSPRAGLIAMALLATDFLHMFLGHFARHWSATVFFIWLGALMAWGLQRNDRPLRYWALAGAVAGMGFGTSYIGGFALAFLAVAWFFRRPWRFDQATILLLVTFALVAGVLVAVHPAPIMRLFTSGVLPIAQPKTLVGYIDMLAFYGQALWWSNPVLLLAGALGLLHALYARKWHLVGGALLCPLGYTVFLYLAMPLEDRYILPVVPMLALLAGVAGSDILMRSGRRHVVVAALMLLLLLPSALISAHSAIMLSRDDTRLLAKRWLMDKPVDEGIAVISTSMRLEPNTKAISVMGEFDPGVLRAQDRLVGKYQGGDVSRLGGGERRFVLNLDPTRTKNPIMLDGNALAVWLKERGVKWVAVDVSRAETDWPFFIGLKAVAGEPAMVITPAVDGLMPPNLRTTLLVDYPLYRMLKFERFGPMVLVFHLK